MAVVEHAEQAGRPWKRATAWLLLLGPVFFLSYGWANALAAARADVPSVAFAWEAAIPFVAWTIVPYWSIDLFYGVSLFVCRDRRELDRQGLRLLTAQAIAVGCFIAWPLRFEFVRPPAEGVFGAMFDVLMGFDKPFNQAPSLHIVLLVVLWLRFGAHVRGAWRWVLHGWAALIAVSVLTTYQHHFLDVPTGALAGLLCAWLWPMRLAPPWRTTDPAARDPVRWKLAAAYFSAALACVLAAWSFGGMGLWLLWPATSLLLVAANYAWVGAAGFQKQADGRSTVAARWLYAPYRLGAWLNSRWWTRRAPAPVAVADGIALGRTPTARAASAFATLVDCGAELDAPRGVAVVACPMLDLVAPSPARLREAALAIDAAQRRGGRVLVCCALGYSRSAAAVAAWLLVTRRAATVDAAIARVVAARPAVVLRASHRRALQALVSIPTDVPALAASTAHA